jgi:hypothetical protein
MYPQYLSAFQHVVSHIYHPLVITIISVCIFGSRTNHYVTTYLTHHVSSDMSPPVRSPGALLAIGSLHIVCLIYFISASKSLPMTGKLNEKAKRPS